MIKWLWSIIWGKKKRRRRSRGRSVIRWFTPGLTVTGVIGTILAAITGQISLPTLDTLRGTETPVFNDPVAESLGGGRLQPSALGPTVGGSSAAQSGSMMIRPTGFAAENFPGGTNRSSVSRSSVRGDGAIETSFSSQATAGGKSDHSIRMATFNIQMFGKSKTGKTEVMQQLAWIFMQFDLVAVQEIKGDPTIPLNDLLGRIRQLGGNYQAIHSPPLGRTSQTECYGYVWDQNRIDFVPDSDYVIEDRADRMHRPPMVASFQVRVAPVDSRRPFRFTLINAHTDPDLVKGDGPGNELNVLDDVFQRVREFEYSVSGEEDFILLGDLNVDSRGLAELGRIPNVVSLAGDVLTNTRKSETYDHLVLDQQVTREFARSAGVMDLESFLQVDQAAALKVSDHLPVWAEFSVYEAPNY